MRVWEEMPNEEEYVVSMDWVDRMKLGGIYLSGVMSTDWSR